MRTERLDYDGPLLDWAEPEHPLAFLRGGEGIVGFGERTSFRHEGPERIAVLARWWRELCDAADVHDDVMLPGTGLTAFGSFAFSDTSASASVRSFCARRTATSCGTASHWSTTPPSS